MLYCAAGYRSHIAVSLIKRLLEKEQQQQQLQTKRRTLATDHEPHKHKNIELSLPCPSAAAAVLLDVVDVEGGALRIMTYRPDLWTVKDRSIICIS